MRGRTHDWLHRTAMFACLPLAAASLGACVKSTEPSTSSASNWLVCSELADCSDDPRAVACSAGFCVDEQGARLRSETTSSLDAGSASREPIPSAPAPGTWKQLSAPPLSGRTGALLAAVGDTLIVAGGWDFLCPPLADCVTPDVPPHSDAAAYSMRTGEWKTLSDAPVGFESVTSAVVGSDLYALSRCEEGPLCPAGRSLLRYRSEDDEWDLLPGPSETGFYHLTSVPDGVVAYSDSNETRSVPDYVFLAAEDRWEELPDDPLPSDYDRFLVELDGRYLLFGTPVGGEAKTKHVASYDPRTKTWQRLESSNSQGYQVWRAGSLLYLNPHFGATGGGIFDPVENAWQPLPDPPTYDLAGVLGESEASYEYAEGWVLDTRSGDWLEVEPRPGSSEVGDAMVATAPGQGLAVFGGQTWSDGEGTLLNDTWLWSPPKVSP